MNADKMKNMVDALTPQERVQLADIVLGKHVTRLLAKHGGVELYAEGKEYAPEPDAYAIVVDNEYQSDTHYYYQNAFDDLDYLHREDLDALYDQLKESGAPNWQQDIEKGN